MSSTFIDNNLQIIDMAKAGGFVIEERCDTSLPKGSQKISIEGHRLIVSVQNMELHREEQAELIYEHQSRQEKQLEMASGKSTEPEVNKTSEQWTEFKVNTKRSVTRKLSGKDLALHDYELQVIMLSRRLSNHRERTHGQLEQHK